VLSRIAAAFALLAAPLAAAAPYLEKSVLFERGKGDYLIYRIPGIVVTKAGTVLAYTEARKTDRGDWGESGILLRRSTDGGKTWSEPALIGTIAQPFPKNPRAIERNLGTGAGVTYNNPVAIADRNGSVHFLFCVEYMRSFYMRSDDDGIHFGKPVEITSTCAAFQKEYPWSVIATGPGHGIQLRNGRLVVPVWLSPGTGAGAHGPSVASVIYSDDHGKRWRRGDIAVPDTPEWSSPNETAAVELADGRVMLNVRSPSTRHRRIIVTSKDGATKWTRPEFHEQLLEPICFASMARIFGRLLFVNPDNLARADGNERPGVNRDRRNLTVQLSDDEGKRWSVKRVVEPGPSAYADLAVLPDGTILCFYEAGRGTASLTLARFNLEWLTGGQ
jgi:sialidase-1